VQRDAGLAARVLRLLKLAQRWAKETAKKALQREEEELER